MKAFIDIDLSAAELWATAAYAGDKGLQEVLESGEDPHVDMAHRMFGISKENLIDEDKTLGKDNSPTDIRNYRSFVNPSYLEGVATPPVATVTGRQLGKAVNYGLSYRMREQTFSITSGIALADCKVLIKLHEKACPKKVDWWKSLNKELQTQERLLFNCFGRGVRLLDSWSPRLLNQATAFKPQSTIADLVRAAMSNLWCWSMDQPVDKRPGHLVAQVHDSLTYLLKVGTEDEQWRAAQFIAGAAGPGGLGMPLKIEAWDGSIWEFSIPLDAKLGTRNMGEMTHLGLSTDPEEQFSFLQAAINVDKAGYST